METENVSLKRLRAMHLCRPLSTWVVRRTQRPIAIGATFRYIVIDRIGPMSRSLGDNHTADSCDSILIFCRELICLEEPQLLREDETTVALVQLNRPQEF
jgi:hypothetical protein